MQAKLQNACFVSSPAMQHCVVWTPTPSRRHGGDGRRSHGEEEERRQTAQRRSHSSRRGDHEEPCRSRSLHDGHHHLRHHAHRRSGRRGSDRHAGRRSRRVCRHRSRGPVSRSVSGKPGWKKAILHRNGHGDHRDGRRSVWVGRGPMVMLATKPMRHGDLIFSLTS